MTASFVDYMEQNAYDSAVRDYCLPSREKGRVSVTELFDSIAGSETGAIIASALVIPAQKKNAVEDLIIWNENYAVDVKKWFFENTDRLYKHYKINVLWKVLISLIFTATFGFITYKLVERHFEDPLFYENVDSLKTLVKLEKKVHKNKASDDHKKEHKEIKDALT